MIDDILNPWRSDLENAPKDEWIELYQPNDGWGNKVSCCMWEDNWWHVNDNKHFPPLRGEEPTHWRYLPTPPGTVNPTAEKVREVLRAAIVLINMFPQWVEVLVPETQDFAMLVEALPQEARDWAVGDLRARFSVLLYQEMPDTTLKQKAEKLGISPSYLSDILKGNRGSSEKLIGLLDKLGYDVKIRFKDKMEGRK